MDKPPDLPVAFATILVKNQITIPKIVVDAFNLKKGERLLFYQRGDEIVIRKATRPVRLP